METETATDRVMRGAARLAFLTREDETKLFQALRAGESACESLAAVGLVLVSRFSQYVFVMSGDRTNPPTLQEKTFMRSARIGIKARATLIERNRRLVLKFVKPYANKPHFDDIYQSGLVGLNRAIDKFQPSKGNKLSTYAGWWIRCQAKLCADTTDNNIKIPLDIIDALTQINKLRQTLRINGGPAPTDAAVIAEFNRRHIYQNRSLMTPEKLAMYLSANRRLSSLDREFEPGGRTFIDTVICPDDRSSISDTDTEIFFEQATIGFDNTQISALRLNIFNGYSCAEVSKELGFEKDAMRRLKNKFRKRSKFLISEGFGL